MTVNRYCSSGLQTIAIAADRIATGGADVIVAGGLETMSMIPMGGNVVRPNPARSSIHTRTITSTWA
jgi:acetyl-CoA acyltransferase